MTKMKKILAVGLAGLMAVGFAACSGSKDSTTTDDAKTDATATAKTGYAISSEIKEDEYNKSETALEIDSVCAAVLVDADGKIIDVKIDEAQTKPDLKKDNGERNPDIEQIALHEAAHVAAAEVLKPGSVSLVTLRKNGRTQGMTQYYCDNEISTEDDFLNLAVKSLAGKAGVEMVCGRFDMGASEDIQAAVGHVRQWSESFGGSGFSGIVYDQRAASETILAQNERLAAAKLEELYRTAQTILRNNRDFLLAVQRALLERETLLGSDITAIRELEITRCNTIN